MALENKYRVQENLNFLIYDISNIPTDLDVREKFLETTYKTISDLIKIPGLDQDDLQSLDNIKKCVENSKHGLLNESKEHIAKAEVLICNMILKYK
jgi:hypothetical protein